MSDSSSERGSAQLQPPVSSSNGKGGVNVYSDERFVASESNSLFHKVYFELRWMLNLNRGGRNFKVFPDDRFLVSYPRSGNTWTRFLIAHLLFPDRDITFLNIDYLVPDVLNLTRRELNRVPRPRLIKSHEYFDPRYKKVIYIVRDPRDVVVSHYFFHLKEGFFSDSYPMEKFVQRWVAGDVDPFFASWGENVTSWIATRAHGPDFLLLRYEDMKANPAGELAKVGDFLKIPHDQAALEKAVQLSTADRMRKLEDQQQKDWIGTRKKRKDVRYVRGASVGGWQSTLSERDVATIERAWAPVMRFLGYQPVSRPGDDNTALSALLTDPLVR